MRNASKAVTSTMCSAIVLTLALTVSACLALLNTDKLVERSLTAALKSDGQTPGTPRQAGTLPVAGSEDFWLREAHGQGAPDTAIQLVSGSAPVVVGQTIKLSLDGKDRNFEVTEVIELASDTTRIETGTGSRLLLVTCRDKDLPGAALVRIITERSPEQIERPDRLVQRAL